jgi:hypothetical protein
MNRPGVWRRHQVSIESVPDAGHALTVSHFDICAARIALADT